MSVPQMFSNTVQQTAEWFKIMMECEGIPGERQAYAALRAVLHQLRDRLPMNEAVNLGAQLPLLVRGIYYEGWNPSKTPEKVHLEEFVQGVANKLTGHEEIPPQNAIDATIRVLSEHVTEGEIQHVLGTLPKDLQSMWENSRNMQGGQSAQGSQGARLQ